MTAWFARHIGAFLVTITVLLCGPAIAQIALEWRDYATLFGYTGAKFDICWSQIDDGTRPAEWVEFRRTRAEGGVPEVSPRYARADWLPGGRAGEFCLKEQHLPRGGHFVYEIKGCYHVAPPAGPGDVCSGWASSTNPAFARVNNQPRAWWIYGHPAPPSGGGIEDDPPPQPIRTFDF